MTPRLSKNCKACGADLPVRNPEDCGYEKCPIDCSTGEPMTQQASQDGEAAFPQNDFVDRDGNVQTGAPGMTLRDYFAAKAMHWCLQQDSFGSYAETAEQSYAMADAMLKARKQ